MFQEEGLSVSVLSLHWTTQLHVPLVRGAHICTESHCFRALQQFEHVPMDEIKSAVRGPNTTVCRVSSGSAFWQHKNWVWFCSYSYNHLWCIYRITSWGTEAKPLKRWSNFSYTCSQPVKTTVKTHLSPSHLDCMANYLTVEYICRRRKCVGGCHQCAGITSQGSASAWVYTRELLNSGCERDLFSADLRFCHEVCSLRITGSEQPKERYWDFFSCFLSGNIFAAQRACWSLAFAGCIIMSLLWLGTFQTFSKNWNCLMGLSAGIVGQFLPTFCFRKKRTVSHSVP